MVTFLACSLAPGAVDTTPERVGWALWIFGMGVFLLGVHTIVFVYRSRKKARRSGWVFWGVLGLSVFIIPVAFYMVLLSAGLRCGFGATHGPTLLLIFQIVGLIVQLATSRPANRPVRLP